MTNDFVYIVNQGDLIGDVRVTNMLPHSGSREAEAGIESRISRAVHVSGVDDDGRVHLLHYVDPDAHHLAMYQDGGGKDAIDLDPDNWRECRCIERAGQVEAAA